MSQEIIELLEKARSMLIAGDPVGYSQQRLYEWIDQALTKLREVPEPTRAIEIIKKSKQTHQDWLAYLEACTIIDRAEARSIDCPNRPASKTEVEMAKRLCAYQDEVHELKQQPPAGDFTKDFRKLLNMPLTTNRIGRIQSRGREACDRLDTSEAARKELREALEDLYRIIVVDDLIPESVSYMKSAKVVLAKEKEAIKPEPKNKEK